MTERDSKHERVTEAHRRLRCQVCGAGNPLTEAAVELGWFQCGHCNSSSMVPGAGAFSVDGPDDIVRTIRPGVSEFRTGQGYLLHPVKLLFLVLAIDLAAGAIVELLQSNWPDLGEPLAPVLIGVLASSILGALLIHMTRFKLRVTENAVEFWHSTVGIPWRRKRIAGDDIAVKVLSDPRHGVELSSSSKRFFVSTHGPIRQAQAAAWLARELVEALEETATVASDSRIPCPGCGGPIASEQELRDSRGLNCPHCETALIQTGGGVALPALRVTLPDPIVSGKAVSKRTSAGMLWETRSWSKDHPVAALLNILFGLLLFGGLSWFGWFVVLTAPMLNTTAAFFVFAFTGLAIYGSSGLCLDLFARNRFVLTPHVLEHSQRLGPWKFRSRRFPLARILSVSATHDLDLRERPHQGLKLVIKTATGEVERTLWGLTLNPVLRDLLAAVAGNARALGRTSEKNPRARKESLSTMRN